MRHHGRADDADRDVEHLRIGDDLGRGQEAAEQRDATGGAAAAIWIAKQVAMTIRSAMMKASRKRKPAIHQEKQQERVERRDQRAADQRNAEEQLQRDGRADHLGQVAGDDRRLAGEPEHQIDRPRVVVAAGLREIAAGDDAEPRGERLQQDRHQVRQQDDGEQRVAELRAAGDVGRPVARVHVADRDHVAGPGEGEHPAKPRCRRAAPESSSSPPAGWPGQHRSAPNASRYSTHRRPRSRTNCAWVLSENENDNYSQSRRTAAFRQE